jgi:hypothetical protein
MERRSAERVQFAAPTTIGENVRLSCGGYGKIVNICNNGAFIKVAGNYSVNDKLTVSIHLVSAKAVVSVTIPGTVTRISGGGIGFHSPHLDMPSLLHFGELVQNSQGNVLKMKNDFYVYAIDALYPLTLAESMTH